MTEYLIKSVFCFSILYFCYFILLKKSTSYHANRFLLLFSVFFSLLVPLVDISTITASQFPLIKQNVDLLNVLSYQNYFPHQTSVTTEAPKSVISLSLVLTIAYIFTSLVLMIRFFINICTLFLKGYKGEKVNHNKTKLTLIDDPINPFTFFKTIFINRRDYLNGVENELLLHEQAHKNQLHSIDVVIMELIQVFFWFNPFVYLFKKLIKANHEYLADDFVLKSGIAPGDYSNKLLHYTFRSKGLALTSGFNHLLIKNRLLMSSKFNQKRRIAYKFVFFLPLFAILFLTTAFKNQNGTRTNTNNQTKGVFYADTLFWSAENNKLYLKGTVDVKFGENDFKGEGSFSVFGKVNLLIVDDQKIPLNSLVAISGKKCSVTILTKEEATKQYGPEGASGAVIISTRN